MEEEEEEEEVEEEERRKNVCLFFHLHPPTHLPSSTGHAFISYVEKFGTKLCCCEDLLPYTTALAHASPTPRGWVIGRLEELARESSVEGKTDEALQEEERKEVGGRLQRFIRTQQVLRVLKGKGGVGGWEEEVKGLSREYDRTRFVNEEAEGGQREVQQGDELVLLCVESLLQGVEEEEDGGGDRGEAEKKRRRRRRTVEAICLLEQALRYSPYNYHFRLVLLDLYARLGAWAPVRPLPLFATHPPSHPLTQYVQ